jgi:hypothetical protein
VTARGKLYLNVGNDAVSKLDLRLDRRGFLGISGDGEGLVIEHYFHQPLVAVLAPLPWILNA